MRMMVPSSDKSLPSSSKRVIVWLLARNLARMEAPAAPMGLEISV